MIRGTAVDKTSFSIPVFFVFFIISYLALSQPAFAIAVDALRAPLQAFKAETFSWMFGVKVAFVAAGAVMSAAKMTLTPFGIGAGAFAGIHLMERYIGDGAGALI